MILSEIQFLYSFFSECEKGKIGVGRLEGLFIHPYWKRINLVPGEFSGFYLKLMKVENNSNENIQSNLGTKL